MASDQSDIDMPDASSLLHLSEQRQHSSPPFKLPERRQRSSLLEPLIELYEQRQMTFPLNVSAQRQINSPAPPLSAGRKRSHSEFQASQDLPIQDRPRHVRGGNIPEPVPVVRYCYTVGGWIAKAGGWAWAVVCYTLGVAYRFCSIRVPEEQVTVVQVGNKRRAVTIPGEFPASPARDTAALSSPKMSTMPVKKQEKARSSPAKNLAKTNTAAEAAVAPQTSTTQPKEVEKTNIRPVEGPKNLTQVNAAVEITAEASTSTMPAKPSENGPKLPTPPVSRPGSSNSAKVPESRRTFPMPAPTPEEIHARYAKKHKEQSFGRRRAKPILPSFVYPKSILKDQERDRQVDLLIKKAKKVLVESPDTTIAKQRAEEKRAKAAEEERKAREAEEQKAKEAKAAEKRAKKEAKEAEAQAKREAHEAKLAAEREALADVLPPGSDESDVEKHRTSHLISALSSNWESRIDREMAMHSTHPVVTSPAGVELTRQHFGTLLPQLGSSDDPKGWLLDEIVNAFISTIVTTKQKETGYRGRGSTDVPVYQAYESNWYQKYKTTNSVHELATWSRRRGIQGEKLLQAEKLFFPINPGGHWMLLIISPKQRTVEFLDSFNSTSARARYLGIAHEWLEMELKSKYNRSEWIDLPSKSEEQLNFNDCGVFVCFNALASAKGVPFSEVKAEKMPEARRLLAAILMKRELTEEFQL